MSDPLSHDRLAIVGAVIAAMVVVVACSSSSAPARANDEVGPSDSGPATHADGSAAHDAADGEGGAGGGDGGGGALTCSPGALQANTWIGELTETMSAPAAQGGTLKAGIYDLTLLFAFDPNNSADASAGTTEYLDGLGGKGTLVVTPASIELHEAFGSTASQPAATVGAAGTVTIAGTKLVITTVCGSPPASIGFTSGGPNDLSLYPDARHRRVYQRRL